MLMRFDDLLRATNISGSGLSAERRRMEVVANNIANAFATRTPEGGPFRRQEVIFSTVLEERMRSGVALGGVEVLDVVDDPSDFIRVHQPGHPDADADGMVAFPNVQLPIEMTNLITASRAYEANVRAAQAFRQMAEQALAIIRG
jgi:flagellar basal-body rod protein FlgC